MPLDVFLAVAPVYAHSIDGRGRLLNVSTLWAEELQYKPEEMIGRASTDFLTEKSEIEARTEHLPRFFQEGSLRQVPYVFERRDGSHCSVLMDAGSLSAKGKFERSLAIFYKLPETNAAVKTKLSLLLADLSVATSEDAAALAPARIREIIDNL